MRAVNLLPIEQRAGGKSIRQEDPAVVVGSALGVVVMIALIASFLTAHGKASAQQAKLTAARLELAQLSEKRKAELAKLKPVKPTAPVTPIVPPPTVTGQEASWLSSVSQVLGQRIAWDRLLREVSLVMPSDVSLSALTLTAPATTAGAAPAQGFVITGSAYSYDSVARLLSRLALVPDLENVQLSNSSSGTAPGAAGGSSSSSGSGLVQFNISAAVKGAAPVATTPAATTPAVTTDTTEGGSA
jgi:Fimbrial assembly protein (PilN)